MLDFLLKCHACVFFSRPSRNSLSHLCHCVYFDWMIIIEMALKIEIGWEHKHNAQLHCFNFQKNTVRRLRPGVSLFWMHFNRCTEATIPRWPSECRQAHAFVWHQDENSHEFLIEWNRVNILWLKLTVVTAIFKTMDFFVDEKIVSLNEKKMSLLCEEEGTSDLLSFFEMKSLFDTKKKFMNSNRKEKIPP